MWTAGQVVADACHGCSYIRGLYKNQTVQDPGPIQAWQSHEEWKAMEILKNEDSTYTEWLWRALLVCLTDELTKKKAQSGWENRNDREDLQSLVPVVA